MGRDGELDDRARAARGCTRLDLPPVTWGVDERLVRLVGAYTGRQELCCDAERDGTSQQRQHPPGEDPAEGCPAGWRWNAFTIAFDPYIRMRTTTGGRVSNPLLDRCDDPLIHALVVQYERDHERCIAHRHKIEDEHRART